MSDKLYRIACKFIGSSKPEIRGAVLMTKKEAMRECWRLNKLYLRIRFYPEEVEDKSDLD